MSQRESSFRTRVSRIFRERELYVRSDGHIRYITIKPYMLMLSAGFIATLLLSGISGTLVYFLTGNPEIAIEKKPDKIMAASGSSPEKLIRNYQVRLKKLTGSTTARLISQKKKYERELKNLRDAYELQLAQFQSSVNQINGAMAKNQGAYVKELARLRTVYTSLKQRHSRLETLMDQGWAPRMVTIPEISKNDGSDDGQNDDPSAPVTAQGNRLKKKSSFIPGNISMDIKPPVFVAAAPSLQSGPDPLDVSKLEASMQTLWKKQNRTSAQINFSARKRVKEMVQILLRLKFKLSELKLASAFSQQSNTGGPFVELAFADIASNSKKLDTFNFAALQPFKKIFVLEKALLELPIRRPLSDLRSITSPFGARLDPFRKIYAMHRGIDFRAPMGEPVLATARGVVVLATSNSKTGYGKMLVIRHKHGITTLYGHLSELTVKTGDIVKPGDVVGKVGNTGRSTGPHLHYEVRVNDSHVDPIDYLEAATHVF